MSNCCLPHYAHSGESGRHHLPRLHAQQRIAIISNGGTRQRFQKNCSKAYKISGHWTVRHKGRSVTLSSAYISGADGWETLLVLLP